MCEIINKEGIISDKEIVEVLKSVFDPDIHYSVYDIGLIYKVEVANKTIDVTMTLTSADCPEAQSLPLNIQNALADKFSSYKIIVEVVFEPAWTVDNMSDEVKLGLGLL